ncbi:hypothetical protein DCAR_0934453 [Daucus carota subsp. sativus]|uniref:HECT-type E3 ubiquitin transferase n=1 Tax=Daucus carota subsp. sativus TaxID=79200 RepID=A0AAF0XV97_DAUCS|nr:hypothetical protein DCAR_0934453 [Daucus carota subsp. sativus]
MSLIDSCKHKLDAYTRVDDGVSSSSAVTMRSDVINSVSGARSAACSAESSKSHSSLQFLVRLFSGMNTLVIRADVNDTIGYVLDLIQSKARIPSNVQMLIYKSKQIYPEQTLGECCVENDAVLQLVGVMRSTRLVKAQQLVDEIVSLIWRLCKRNSGNEAWDREARRVIRRNLSDYFGDFLPKDNDNYFGHYLQVFCCSHVPASLAMLYMSPQNMIFGNELIQELITLISLLPRHLSLQCIPIYLEICKALRGMPYYRNDAMFNTCRRCLSDMVKCTEMKTAPNGAGYAYLVNFIRDMQTFVAEAADEIVHSMDAGIEPDTRMSPSHPLLTEVVYLKNFLMPIETFITEELFFEFRYRKVSQDGPYQEFSIMFETFFRLLNKMDYCLEELEKLLPTKSENLGCYQYVAIIMELNNMSKHFPDLAKQFWTTLRNRKLSFSYLIIKYASREDDYEWISVHKEVTNFECRRHLAMMLLARVSGEDNNLIQEIMLIDRSRLLEDSFEYIAHSEAETLRASLDLQFKDEEATGPGVLREWFVLVCQAIFDPRNALFVACPNDRRRFFPNSVSRVDPLHLEYFKFAGRVIALALIRKVQVGIVFDRVFFQQLAGKRVSVDDIRDTDPVFYSSCKRILEMDPDEVDQDALALTFIVEADNFGSKNIVELLPDGKNISVNSKNRVNYVARLVQHHFVDSVKDQVAQFTQGFDDIMNSDRLRESFFQCLELEDFDWMLYGSERPLCVEDWKSHTDYNGYEETDPQISWFWETVASMSAGQRKALLFFWTSLKNLPVEGFGGLTSRLYIYKVNETCNRLPTSQTCFYRLCFPPYQSLEVMQDRLSLVTQEHVACSFGTA